VTVTLKEGWLEIIGSFMHLEQQEIEVSGRTIKKETLIVPRYHQLDAVRGLTADAREIGPGHNYLKIDKHSSQLAPALAAGVNIIITTLQKFPFVLGKVGDLPQRRYAVIVDEAHSSQGGEVAKEMKEVLTVIDMERTIHEGGAEDASDENDDPQDEVVKSMQARGRQPNLSFFAFTATPKPKTLELFGVRNAEGPPEPFCLYSVRQAIARFLSLHPHNLAQKRPK
jgi:hypothetical protein